MKKFLSLMGACLLSFIPAAMAQSGTFPVNPVTYQWTNLTPATGAVLPYLTFTAPPISYSVDWFTTGTAPSTCTFEVETSSDGVHWNTGTGANGSASGTETCTSATNQTVPIAYKPATYIQIKVLTYTGGDGTTKLNFFFTRNRIAQ